MKLSTVLWICATLLFMITVPMTYLYQSTLVGFVITAIAFICGTSAVSCEDNNI